MGSFRLRVWREGGRVVTAAFGDMVRSALSHGASVEALVEGALGVASEQVSRNVILAPTWSPEAVGLAQQSEVLATSSNAVRCWRVGGGGSGITFIRTGIGAPMALDACLALGLTGAETVLFMGSVGGLDQELNIGDYVVPGGAYSAVGASRFLSSGLLKENDPFGLRESFSKSLCDRAVRALQRAAPGARVLGGPVLSVDTVWAQFGHIDELRATGCIGVDMELAAVAGAARVARLDLAAMLVVSDNLMQSKTLVGGRGPMDDMARSAARGKVGEAALLFFER